MLQKKFKFQQNNMHKYEIPKWCSKAGAKMEIITKNITIQKIENSEYA